MEKRKQDDREGRMTADPIAGVSQIETITQITQI